MTDRHCPLSMPSCVGCMYTTDEECLHAKTSGLSEDIIFEMRAVELNLKGERLAQHVAKYSTRIQHALILESYSRYIKLMRKATVLDEALRVVLPDALRKSLLLAVATELRLTQQELAAMCIRRNWQTFASMNKLDKTFEEVSEANVSSLLLLRSRLPV